MNNANQDNLWHELTLQGHKENKLDLSLSVKTIMDSWTLKKGYPVVFVKRIFDVNESNETSTTTSELVVTQRWFLLNPSSKAYNQKSVYTNYKWYVPFTYTTKSELNFEFESKPYWLMPNDTETNITIRNANKNDWIIGNVKHSGFYRVNYEAENWKLLSEQLNSADFNLIDVTSRSVIIDDAFNLGKAEYLEQTMFLNIVKYLRNEVNGMPFEAASTGLNFMSSMLVNNFTANKLFKVCKLKQNNGKSLCVDFGDFKIWSNSISVVYRPIFLKNKSVDFCPDIKNSFLNKV